MSYILIFYYSNILIISNNISYKQEEKMNSLHRSSINTPVADTSRSIVRQRPSPVRVIFNMSLQVVFASYRFAQFAFPAGVSFAALVIANDAKNLPMVLGMSVMTALFAITGLVSALRYADKEEGAETPLRAWFSTTVYPFERAVEWYNNTAKRIEENQ